MEVYFTKAFKKSHSDMNQTYNLVRHTEESQHSLFILTDNYVSFEQGCLPQNGGPAVFNDYSRRWHNINFRVFETGPCLDRGKLMFL